MAKFCIASPHKDDTWYDYRLFVNLKTMLEQMGHVYQAGAQNRIYFLGGPQRLHYPKVGEFDENANNMALIYCHFQKLTQISQFKHVFVASNHVKKYYEEKAKTEPEQFSTQLPIEIMRPFSSLTPTKKNKPKYSCDIAFMGTPRVRPIVEAVIDIVERHQLDLKIIGPSWSIYPGDSRAKKYWLTPSIPYDEIPLLAKEAKININDHHLTMNEVGAVSHKYVDLISAGGLVVCDQNPDASNWYKGEVFSDAKNLESLILTYLSDEQKRQQQLQMQFEIVKHQTTRQAAHCFGRYFLE